MATLDCKVLSEPHEFELGKTWQGWEFNIADRGCEMSNQTFLRNVSESQANNYIYTYTTHTCSMEAGFSRIFVIAASRPSGTAVNTDSSSFTFVNKTAVSCIPAYYNPMGQSNISIEPGRLQNPTIVNYAPHNVEEMLPRPPWAWYFEDNINRPGAIDDVVRIQASYFGRVIYSYMETKYGVSYIDGDVLRKAIENIFTSAVAVMANRYLIQTVQPSRIHGTVLVDETRLIVVLPVACVVVAILTGVFVMLVWILVYSNTHSSIQYEESVGLVGAAAILRNSDVANRVNGIVAHACGGKVAQEFARQIQARYPPEGWQFENWETPNSAAVKSTTNAQKFGFRRIFCR